MAVMGLSNKSHGYPWLFYVDLKNQNKVMTHSFGDALHFTNLITEARQRTIAVK